MNVRWLDLRRHSPGVVEPSSPREKHGDVSWVVSTLMPPVPASVRFESALTSALHTLPFGFNSGDAVTGTQGIGIWSRCADYTAIWTILQVIRCLVYYSSLACRPFDTHGKWSWIIRHLQLPWWRVHSHTRMSSTCSTNIKFLVLSQTKRHLV